MYDPLNQGAVVDVGVSVATLAVLRLAACEPDLGGLLLAPWSPIARGKITPAFIPAPGLLRRWNIKQQMVF